MHLNSADLWPMLRLIKILKVKKFYLQNSSYDITLRSQINTEPTTRNFGKPFNPADLESKIKNLKMQIRKESMEKDKKTFKPYCMRKK